MRIPGLLLATALALAVAAAQAPSLLAAKSPLKIASFSSIFVPDQKATQYTVQATDAPGKTLKYVWYLDLVRVDPKGAPSPASPDARAAVDTTCNNAKLPGGQQVEDFGIVDAAYEWRNQGSTFLWYHGDPGSYPDTPYGCDHTKMGPSGHQGIVGVVVSDGNWACSAYARGSNLGLDPLPGIIGIGCSHASAKGVVQRTENGYSVTFTNTGNTTLVLVHFEPPDGVRIRNIEGPGKIEVIPHGEGFNWLPPDGFKPGDAVTFTFDTDDPYPPGEGKLVIVDAGETEYTGDLEGPTPHAPPPPPPDKLKPCKCAALSLKLDPTLLNKRLPPDKHDFGVGIDWTLTCTGGRGSCVGYLTFSPPEVLVGSVPQPRGALRLNLKHETLTCATPCATSTKGRFEIKMLSRNQLNKLFGRTLAYTVVLECANISTRQVVRVFVDRKGVLRRP